MKNLEMIQEDVNNVKQVKLKKPKTLLQNIERIIELGEDSKLSDQFYKDAKSSINAVAKTMNLTANQAVLFSFFIEKCYENNIRIHELSKFFGCKNTKTIFLINDVDELEKRRLVRCRKSDELPKYRVPIDVVNAVKHNIVYQPKNTKNLDTHELFQHIEQLFDERGEKEISQNSLLDEFNALFEDNPSLAFCKQMKEYDDECDRVGLLLLLFTCHNFINKEDDCIYFNELEDVFESKSQLHRLKTGFREGSHYLLEKDIIEFTNEDGFSNKESFRISTSAKEKLFAELEIKKHNVENKKGLMLCKDITSKELYYNEREKSQIAQLSSLLEVENFVSVVENLGKNGMRKGFAALFYGAPGTGKTETVYQIARKTGRDIMMVDISDTKSCWFGASEKKIKEVFDKYRAFVKKCETAPILLFNEADAVIGKRKDSTSGNVAQTENAIQNIILQEMENLEGIMIATTNLTQNLDKAFERRFLYKIEFNKPGVEAKEKIWQAMLPVLSEKERLELAKTYNFSGGQIENIIRKYTVDSILNGASPSFQTIQSYCQTEFLYKEDGCKRIGFVTD